MNDAHCYRNLLLIGHSRPWKSVGWRRLRCESTPHGSQAACAKSQMEAIKSGFMLHRNVDRPFDRIKCMQPSIPYLGTSGVFCHLLSVQIVLYQTGESWSFAGWDVSSHRKSALCSWWSHRSKTVMLKRNLRTGIYKTKKFKFSCFVYWRCLSAQFVLQYGGFCTMWSPAAKDSLFKVVKSGAPHYVLLDWKNRHDYCQQNVMLSLWINERVAGTLRNKPGMPWPQVINLFTKMNPFEKLGRMARTSADFH